MSARAVVALFVVSLAFPAFAKEGILRVKDRVPGEYVVVFEHSVRDVETTPPNWCSGTAAENATSTSMR